MINYEKNNKVLDRIRNEVERNVIYYFNKGKDLLAIRTRIHVHNVNRLEYSNFYEVSVMRENKRYAYEGCHTLQTKEQVDKLLKAFDPVGPPEGKEWIKLNLKGYIDDFKNNRLAVLEKIPEL